MASDTPLESVPYADLIDVDPPPREMTPMMRRFLFHQSWRTSRLFGVALFFAAIAITILIRFPSLGAGIAAGGFTALLVLSIVRVRRRRARLQHVLVDGVQTPAQVARAEDHSMPTSVGVRARWTNVALKVEGRSVQVHSVDRSLEELEPGTWLRVLIHPDHPDLVIPVVSFT